MAQNFLTSNHQHAQSLWGFSNLPSTMRLQAGESFHEQWERQGHEKRRASFLPKLFSSKKTAHGGGSAATVESDYVQDSSETEKAIAAAAEAEDERIDTVVLAESSGLKLSKTGNYVAPRLCELFVSRLLHGKDSAG